MKFNPSKPKEFDFLVLTEKQAEAFVFIQTSTIKPNMAHVKTLLKLNLIELIGKEYWPVKNSDIAFMNFCDSMSFFGKNNEKHFKKITGQEFKRKSAPITPNL